MTNSIGACSDEATVWPGIDRAGQHDAVDRRVDRALFDVGLPLLQFGFGDGEVGLGDLDGAGGAVARGGRRLQRLVGDHAAGRQLLLADQRLLAFLQCGAGVVDPGVGRLGRGLRAFDLRGEPRRVELGQHVALVHEVVLVDRDGAHDARQFAGNVDLGQRLQRAGRRNRDGEAVLRGRDGVVDDLAPAPATARNSRPAAAPSAAIAAST